MAGSAPQRRVAVVTDSTCGLPAGLPEQLGISIVPLTLVLPTRTGLEGVQVMPSEVTAALNAKGSVSTRPPEREAFKQAIAAASGAGSSANPLDVVIVCISEELSQTVVHARQAADEMHHTGVRTLVVDGRSTGMGLGFPVLAAAQAAVAGYPVRAVAREAEDAVARTHTLLYVDTLEHLRRGGRIGAARALLGSALNMKPILHVQEGHIEPLDQVRGEAKALDRLHELAMARAGRGSVQVAVQHVDAADRAAGVAQAMADRLGQRLRGSSISELGAVVAAHVGPGVVGVAVHRLR
jgi:DegV family protein with EDD domain